MNKTKGQCYFDFNAAAPKPAVSTPRDSSAGAFHGVPVYTGPINTETCVCPTCRQRIRKLNPHRMCGQKVRMLELLAKASLSGDGWVKVEEGRSVVVGGNPEAAPYRARAHASRLVWFGLAEHGKRRTGLYRVTPAGMDFLLNSTAVPAMIYCKDGKVVGRSDAVVTIDDVKNVVLDKPYWDRYHLSQVAPANSK